MKRLLTLLLTTSIFLAITCGSAFADSGTSSLPDTVYNLVIQNAVVILGILGALAFAVELVVQLTKDLPGIRKMPTKLYVIVISLLLTELALFIYAAYKGLVVLWYYIILAGFAAFVIAYISIYGWETLKELYNRYTKIGGTGKNEAS